MKAPVFAYGTLAKLQAAVQSGKVTYPTYCWVSDTLQYAFVNKDLQIEIVGLPKLTGTLTKQIILSSLSDGIYEVKGQHKISEDSETIYLSASYILVIVSSDGDTKKVRRITADDIEDYAVSDTGTTERTSVVVTTAYLEEHHYSTEGYVDDKIAALKVTFEEEMKDYVDDIIKEQIAVLVPEEIEKHINTVPEADVRKLFVDDSSDNAPSTPPTKDPDDDIDDLDDPADDNV